MKAKKCVWIKNNLRTFKPWNCWKFKNLEGLLKKWRSYKKKKVYNREVMFLVFGIYSLCFCLGLQSKSSSDVGVKLAFKSSFQPCVPILVTNLTLFGKNPLILTLPPVVRSSSKDCQRTRKFRWYHNGSS